MKKKALFLCLLMILSVVFAGCGSDKDKAADDKDGTTTLIVGFDANFPPYGYKDKSGNYVGFDLDLAKEVAKRNNWEIKLQPIDWDSKDMELKSGTINCIWNGFTINGREDDYTWSDPYVDNIQVIVVKKNSGIKDLKGLAGKIVVVQTDSSAQDVLTSTEDNDEMLALAATFKELQKVPDYNTAFLNLEAGSVDAIAMDVGVAEYQIKNRGNDKFMILDEQLATEKYGVGFKKGNTKLRDAVQKTLDEMMADGTFLKIAKEWDLENSVIIKNS